VNPVLEARPAVVAAMALAALVTTMGPVAAAAWWARRTRAPLSVALFGALVFFVSQVVLRLPWQIPLGVWLGPRIKGHWALGVAWIAASALTAGLFEEIGRWAGYRWLLRRERSFRVGVMFGIGHGGVESMLLVGLNLGVSAVLYVLFASGHAPVMPAEAATKVVDALSALAPADLLAATLERAMAMTFHVAASLVVLQCFTRGSKAWLVGAVLLHFATDFVGVEGALQLKRWGSLAAEAAVLPSFVVAVAIIVRARRWPQ
jgi:uncharacterized membrane protein YhfC